MACCYRGSLRIADRGLNDAAYDIGENDRFIDEENNLAIVLLRKVDLSYEILITTPEQARGLDLGA